MNNTSTNLADSLFALLEARKELDELDEHPGRGFRVIEKVRALREQAYARAAERYEQAVVDSCIEKWPAGFLPEDARGG